MRENQLCSIAVGALMALAPTVVGSAPSEPSAHGRALAAGYKAAFLCSDLFDAGESEAQAAADDLEGIYPEYQELVRTLPARIDRAARTVSVAFDDHLPPRIAAWRPLLGCAQLPIGADPSGIALLPRLTAAPPAGDADARPWPNGDAGALAPPPGPVAARLEAVVAKAFDGASYGAGTRTTAVLVVRDGHIVAERYRDGFDAYRPQRTWSAAKSLTGTLLGRAALLGKLTIDAPARIPEWGHPGDPRATITLADLMHMASGLFTNGPGNRTDEIYLGGGAVTQVATAMPLEAAPGSRFRYANDDVLLAARALRAANGDGEAALAFPFRELLWKIGMNHTTLETDWQGNFILSSQVWTTARDLARLGMLYLADGVWDSERLLPAGWREFVSTPAASQPASAERDGVGYGALFWLFGPRQGLPAATIAMLGSRGQDVLVIPALRLVIVRRGYDSVTPGAPQFDEAAFARAVIAAL